MQISGLQIVACLSLLLGTGFIIVGIITQNWSYYNYEHKLTQTEDFNVKTMGMHDKYLPKSGRRGLFRYCYTSEVESDRKAEDYPPSEAILEMKETCQDRFEKLISPNVTAADETKSKYDLYVKSDYENWDIACLILLCISALLGALALLTSPCCCNKCGCILSLLVLLAAFNAVAAIGVYAYYQDNGIILESDERNFTLKESGFDWSFWCTVVGAACQLFSSILFAVSRNRMQRYTPVSSSGHAYYS